MVAYTILICSNVKKRQWLNMERDETHIHTPIKYGAIFIFDASMVMNEALVELGV